MGQEDDRETGENIASWVEYTGRAVRKAEHMVKYELGSVLRRDSSGYSDLGDPGNPVRSNIRRQGCVRIDVYGGEKPLGGLW